MRIGIIGAGELGCAVARRAALSGAVVLLTDRSAGRARQGAATAGEGAPGRVLATTPTSTFRADLVILATRFPESLELVSAKAEALAGKAVVDVSVPDRVNPAASAVARLAQAAPGARWVKAFTTVDAGVLSRGGADGLTADVFVASDDDRAKVAVVEMADRSGLRAFDAGGIENAWVLEGMGRLGKEVSERLQLQESWSFKFLPYW